MYLFEEFEVARNLCPELSCPHCKTSGMVEISIKGNQIHGGLIPTLAYVKGGEGICNNCGLLIKIKEGGDLYESAYRELKKKTRTPIWRSSGAILILLVFFCAFAYMGWEEYESNIKHSRLDSPKVGDLYVVYINKPNDGNIENPDFTLAKVEKVDEDIVELRYSKNIITQKNPPKLKGLTETPANFDDKVIAVRRKELKDTSLHSSDSTFIGQVCEIKRP